MFKWFKELFRIVREYEDNRHCVLNLIQRAQRNINNAETKAVLAEKRAADSEKIIRDRTTIHADIGMRRHENVIIVVGRYGKQDYVQTFRVDDRDFKSLVEQFRDMSRHAYIDRVDMPYAMSACFNHERDKMDF